MNIFRTIIIVFAVTINSLFTFAQEQQKPDEAKQQPENKPKDDKRFFIRGGFGAQGMITLLIPPELTQYTQDFYDNLLDEYYEFGYYPNSINIPPVYAGYGYTLKADLRLINVFQLETWWEKYYSFPLNITMDYYYYYGSYTQDINVTYQFKPMYEAKGISLLFVPGSARKSVFFTVGGGIGMYTGRLRMEADGEETINGQTTIIYDLDEYKGSAVGYNGVIGLTYVPWKYLEIETLLSGRYVNIPEITDHYGQPLVNVYSDYEPVALQLIGIDFRLGLKFIFP
jgi:hypothetical protein